MLQAQRLVLIDALMDRGQSQVRTLLLVLAGSMVLTLSAKVQVPFYPVPMTLQTLVVLLIGVAFGWRMGFATVLVLASHRASKSSLMSTPNANMSMAGSGAWLGSGSR